MSTWIHCNQCFKVPTNNDNKLRLWFTSCGHLLCDGCLKAQWSNNNGEQRTCFCSVCQQPNVKFVELNRHLKPQLMALFRPPTNLLEEFFAQMKKVFAFQQSHQQRYNRHLVEKAQKAATWAQNTLKANQKLTAECDRLKAQLEQYKEKKEKAEEMLSNAKREVQRRHNTKYRPYTSFSVTQFATTPASVADRPSSTRPRTSMASSSHFPSRPHTALASSSNSSMVSNRRSFSYLSPATLSFNRSVGIVPSGPLLPGRITNAPIVPASFAIHRERSNTDTESFGF